MTKEILNIAVCQCGVEWKAPEENLRRLDAFISRYIGQCSEGDRPDIVVLPEFFAAGFSADVSAAEPENGPTLRWMKDLAVSAGMAVTGSGPVEVDGRVFNRMYFVYPDGNTEHYDKRHLFRMSGEDAAFAGGTERKVVRFQGWRIALNVCYDLRFPVWSRRTPVNDYDVLLNVASWPSSRMEAASILVHARAVENQAWAVFCNRVGDSPENTYCGGSEIVDFKGRNVGDFIRDDATGAGGGFLRATLALEDLRRFRTKFPAWMDADRFNLG